MISFHQSLTVGFILPVGKLALTDILFSFLKREKEREKNPVDLQVGARL